MSKLSTELQRYFFEEDRPTTVTLDDMLDLAGERVFGFLFVVLALPSALPIPAPGYSVPFGILLFLLAMRLIAGKPPWFPKGWLRHPMPTPKVQGIVKAGLPWLRRIEFLSRPRLTPVCTSFVGRTVIGCAIALMATSMMIPIPLTNTLPAIGIFITGFGLLDDDGMISLAGLVVCVMGLALTSAVLIFGYEAVKGAINLIRQNF
ncbi:MAG: exopolysaccharide biosynthesis protein [Oscillatoriales cyanobacterium RM1_1_9]|nr:exopolysaccharide biosynthesis protein [Oscillatoriales cyanobacterium SM2_3_0]NJO45634.1 exopolysaccharide biosynthesis protein [Oscillatoriales cyanobacterium RM2_1_1]NJO72078.1 exopolysaccharide biosynthesis protein [Oscillatoriales cyanobacterium RM1_1_9]